MKNKFSRRDFIKIAGVGVGGIAVGSTLVKYADALGRKEEGEVKITPTYCEMCFFNCAGWVYTKNGKPWKIVGNEIDEHCFGRLCTKGTGGIGAFYDTDRLKRPMIRVGEKGKQQFKEVSWEEALNYTADKMKAIKEKYGPDVFALHYHGTGGEYFNTLLKAVGSNNSAAASYEACRGPREDAFLFTFGDTVDSPEKTDIKNSKCIVLIGSHIGENTHSAQVNEFAQAMNKGAKLIVVDPRFSTAASKADHWLPIKPATDMALLLAWIHVLIEENLYDKKYIEKYADGFNELKQSVAGNTPEWAYPITSIKPEVIRETARLMAGNGNAPATLVHPGRFVVWYGDDTQRVRAIAILNALLGSFGRKGGFYFNESVKMADFPHPPYPKVKTNWKSAMKGRYDLANLPLVMGLVDATIPEKGRDYNIKSWFVYAANLNRSLPAQKKIVEAIKELELLVVIDTMPSEICGWADVILPECTYLERYDKPRASKMRIPQVAVRVPAVEPLYDSKPGYWIAKELAVRLGLGDFFSWKTFEEYVDFRLQKTGTSLDEMKKVGVKSFPRKDPMYIDENGKFEFGTDSGKIELYSKTLAEAGFDPIPKFTKHEEPPTGFYRLNFGRSPSHTFGRTTNNPLLTQLELENELWVNPDVAKEHGIKNNQYVKLENQDGVISSSRIKVKVTKRIRPDCVYMVHGFGHTMKQLKRAYMKGIDDTELITNVKYDPIMGGVGMRSNFVTFKVG